MANKKVMVLKGVFERFINVLKVKPVVHEENKVTLVSAKSNESGKLRHVDINYYYVKEGLVKKNIDIKFIESENQEADGLTKELN